MQLSLGGAQFRNGDAAAVEASWLEAVRVHDRPGEAWNNPAVIYVTSGRKAPAQAAVSIAERAGFKINPRLKGDVRIMK